MQYDDTFYLICLVASLYNTSTNNLQRRQIDNLDIPKYKKILQSFNRLINTFKEKFQNMKNFLFLLAFFLYIDGVHTVMYLASTFAKNLGLNNSSIIIGLIIVQFVAFPATIMWSHIGEKVEFFCNFFSIILYIAIIYLPQLSSATEFYLMAASVGSQLRIQASSRGYFAKMFHKTKQENFWSLILLASWGLYRSTFSWIFLIIFVRYNNGTSSNYITIHFGGLLLIKANK